MKIIFKHLSGKKIDLDGVTSETTLRDVKRFYESMTSTKRSFYSFIINGKKGFVNDNTLNKFSDYLETVHGMNFDASSILVISLVLNLGNNTKLFGNQRFISPDIESKNGSSRLICGISLEMIRGMPVKVNGRYYDSEAFCDYLLSEQSKCRVAVESHQPYVPVCPIRQPLPDILKRIVLFPISELCTTRGSILGVLSSIFNDSIEGYEDDLATVATGPAL